MPPNPQFPADLVTFTEEVLNGILHFLCSDNKTSTKTIKMSDGWTRQLLHQQLSHA